MTDAGDSANTTSKTQAIKAEFVRVLSERVRVVSGDPKQMREMVYELARIKLVEQFTREDARESHQILQVLEQAIGEVERSLQRNAAPATPDVTPAAAPRPPPVMTQLPLSETEGETPRRRAPPRPSVRPKRAGTFSSMVRLAAILLLVAIVGVVIACWPRLKTQIAGLSPRAPTVAQPQPAPTRAPPERGTTERLAEAQKEAPPQPAQPSMPLPITFGVYALSDGQLQELKAIPGKIPDRRVAISAAISTPSATTVSSGDVKFIVFRPDGALETSGTEVRVVAKVSRAMGVDATGKAAVVSAGDSWVVRSMSFPYKVGPVEDQPRMLLLQPETDGFALSPGRYVVVVKGMGYDFTVAGAVTDPSQCVERINAANGAFYSPCPPRR